MKFNVDEQVEVVKLSKENPDLSILGKIGTVKGYNLVNLVIVEINEENYALEEDILDYVIIGRKCFFDYVMEKYYEKDDSKGDFAKSLANMTYFPNIEEEEKIEILNNNRLLLYTLDNNTILKSDEETYNTYLEIKRNYQDYFRTGREE